jgi:hypothetical protein
MGIAPLAVGISMLWLELETLSVILDSALMTCEFDPL